MASASYGQKVATIVPVPANPGLVEYPSLVFTTTICPHWPLMPFLFLFADEVTITPMYEGTVVGGLVLFPGGVEKVVPQLSAGFVVGSFVKSAAKPLNESCAVPPERLFKVHQASLHHVTVVVGVAEATVMSPSANAPVLGNANTIVSSVSLDG